VNPPEYWSGDSSNGTLVLILNPANNTVHKTADFNEVPTVMNGGTYDVFDVWQGKSLGCQKGSYSADVKAHDIMAVLLQDTC